MTVHRLSQCRGHLSQVAILPAFQASPPSAPREPLRGPLLLHRSHPQCNGAAFPPVWKGKGRSSPFPYADEERVPLEDRAIGSESLEAEMKRAQTQWQVLDGLFPSPSDEHKPKNCTHPLSFPLTCNPLSSCLSGPGHQTALSMLGWSPSCPVWGSRCLSHVIIDSILLQRYYFLSFPNPACGHRVLGNLVSLPSGWGRQGIRYLDVCLYLLSLSHAPCSTMVPYFPCSTCH